MSALGGDRLEGVGSAWSWPVRVAMKLCRSSGSELPWSNARWTTIALLGEVVLAAGDARPRHAGRHRASPLPASWAALSRMLEQVL